MSHGLTCSHPEVHAQTLWAENVRLRAEVAAMQAVVVAARVRLASVDTAWAELGLEPADIELLDFNGEWRALRAALSKAESQHP